MEILKGVFIAHIIMLHVALCINPHRVFNTISTAIGKIVLECQKEVPFSDNVIFDFFQYWVPGYPLEREELGCVVFCVLIKLELVDYEGILRKDNVVGFGKANGADDEIVDALISMYEECLGSIKFDFSEPCASGLNLAKCFREKVFLMHWAPKPDAHYEDDEF